MYMYMCINTHISVYMYYYIYLQDHQESLLWSSSRPCISRHRVLGDRVSKCHCSVTVSGASHGAALECLDEAVSKKNNYLNICAQMQILKLNT